MKTIYTDGSCREGKGGWAFVVIHDAFEIQWSDKASGTTNNRMELTAVIEALKTLKNEECLIFSDSQWMINCAEGRWKRNKNLDLWKQFEEERMKQKKVSFQWVKGHSRDEYNDLCDMLAKKEMMSNI